MRPALFAIVVLAALACGPLPSEADDTETAYQALLAQAKTDPPGFDWQALRFAYAARPSFQVFAQSAAKRTMFEAAGKGDCAAALPAARAVIAERFIDADAHMVAAFCEENVGHANAARLDRDIGAGLIRSIETGDGLTPPTAFTVIDVAEEYTAIRALGAHPTEQSLVHADGHSYDRIVTVDDKGRTVTYYFQIDRVLAAESAALKPGSVSEGGPPDRSP